LSEGKTIERILSRVAVQESIGYDGTQQLYPQLKEEDEFTVFEGLIILSCKRVKERRKIIAKIPSFQLKR